MARRGFLRRAAFSMPDQWQAELHHICESTQLPSVQTMYFSDSQTSSLQKGDFSGQQTSSLQKRDFSGLQISCPSKYSDPLHSQDFGSSMTDS